MAKNSKARKARARKVKAKKTNKEVTNEETETMKLSELTVNNLDPLELSENDLDPVIYFSRFLDIPEMIFQHFNGKDLIKIFEVSSTWYNFIASSKVLMKKIKIVFNDTRELLEEDYDLLKNSSRMYESIEFRGYRRQNINQGFVCKKKIQFFFEKSREWKEIGIVKTLFESELDLWELLSAMQSTVERLTIDDVRFKKSLREHNFATENTYLDFSRPFLISTYNYWEFPKLKELRWICFKNRDIGTILSHAVAVEKLELREVHRKTSIKMLKYFDKLTSLKLYAKDILENDRFIEFGFKLKSFTLSFKNAFNFKKARNENVRSNFSNLLLSQSDHLEELFDVTSFSLSEPYMGIESYMENFYGIMRMPNLKTLWIRYFPTLSIYDDDFDILTKISSSITDLRLEKLICAASLKFLLNSMPNVKKLQIYLISKEMFQTLVAMKRKFKELRVYAPKNALVGIDQEALKEICDNVMFLILK